MEQHQHHHPSAHLTYDNQIHEVPATSGEHSQHITYDQTDSSPTGMMMMMMKMYFHFGLGDVVLFESWQVNSAARMWLACALLFVAALLLEAIDYSRGYLSCRCASSGYNSSPTSQTQLIDSGPTIGQVRNEPNGGQESRQWSCCAGSQAASEIPLSPAKKLQYFPIETRDSCWVRALQSVLHLVRTSLSLCLMLVAMTYNVCLIFPIVLGSGFGFYIFYRPALDSKSVMCH